MFHLILIDAIPLSRVRTLESVVENWSGSLRRGPRRKMAQPITKFTHLIIHLLARISEVDENAVLCMTIFSSCSQSSNASLLAYGTLGEGALSISEQQLQMFKALFGMEAGTRD